MGCSNSVSDPTEYDGNTAERVSTCVIHKVSVEEYIANEYRAEYAEGDLVTTGKLSKEDAFQLDRFPVSIIYEGQIVELKDGVIPSGLALVRFPIDYYKAC